MTRVFSATGLLPRRLARICASVLLSSAFVVIFSEGTQTAIANGDTRTLSFYHTHSKEKITVTFKKNGRYDPAALKQLNHFMRDWRNQKSTNMEPRLFDVVWEVQKDAGSRAPIQIVSSYRSPETNEKLRSRSKGVARNSQHTLGRALDIHVPDVPMSKIREAGLRLQRGGVGFYPNSHRPFVHIDVGNVRHWPRMTRDQLVRLFPDGRTVHLPSDGKPLKNYALAMADIQRNGATTRGMSSTQVASAQRNQRTQTARAGGSNFITRFLAGGDEDEGATTTAPAAVPASAPPVAAPAAAPVAVAMASVPLPVARPAAAIPPAMPAPAAPQLAAAYAPQQLPSGPDMIWRSGPEAIGGRAATSQALPPTTAAIAQVAMPMPRPADTTPAARIATAAAPTATIQPGAMAPITASLAPMARGGQRNAARSADIASVQQELRTDDAIAHILAAHDAFGAPATAQAAPAPVAQTSVPAPAPRVKSRASAEIASAPANIDTKAVPASNAVAYGSTRTAVNNAVALSHPNFERTALIAAPARVLPASMAGNPHWGMRSDSFVGSSVVILRELDFGPRRTAQLRSPRG